MATQPSLLKMPFAAEGNRVIIPDTETDDRYASLPQGFPEKTSYPLIDGGVPPRREDFNGILYMLSMFSVYQQSGGLFTYNTSVTYEPPSIIYHNGDLWWCLQKNSPDTQVVTPGSNPAYWIKLKNYLSSPLDAYPVGSYYISSNTTSPAVLFGGTWIQIQNRMIMAAGSIYSVGETGGATSVKLSVANLPSHNHTCSTVGSHTHGAGTLNVTGTFRAGQTNATGAFTKTSDYGSGLDSSHTGGNIKFEASGHWSGATASNGSHDHNIGNTGNGTAVNILPPYIVAYVWRRTA